MLNKTLCRNTAQTPGDGAEHRGVTGCGFPPPPPNRFTQEKGALSWPNASIRLWSCENQSATVKTFIIFFFHFFYWCAGSLVFRERDAGFVKLYSSWSRGGWKCDEVLIRMCLWWSLGLHSDTPSITEAVRRTDRGLFISSHHSRMTRLLESSDGKYCVLGSTVNPVSKIRFLISVAPMQVVSQFRPYSVWTTGYCADGFFSDYSF